MRSLAQAAIVVCNLSTVMMATAVELKRGQDEIAVIIDGKPFTTYYFSSDVAKPYLMPLQTPSGILITRAFPKGNDLSAGDPKNPMSFDPHQRPLFFSHGDINGLDLWEEQAFNSFYQTINPAQTKRGYAHMSLMKLEEVRVGPESGTIRARFSLGDPGNRVIGEETQAYTFRGDDHTRTIDCEFTIYATDNPIVMGDTKEGTFGIRLVSQLSPPLGQMINSEGAEGEQAIWGKPATWVSYRGTISGKPVGIVVFDSPRSFRHPTTWHARAYGLLSANPFGLREFTKDDDKDGSWTIPEGKSLKFRYRVVIYDGAMEPAQLAEMYKKYAGE